MLFYNVICDFTTCAVKFRKKHTFAVNEFVTAKEFVAVCTKVTDRTFFPML